MNDLVVDNKFSSW